MSNHILQETSDGITYACPNLSYSLPVKYATEMILVGFNKEIMSGERNNTVLLQMAQNKTAGAILLTWLNLNLSMDK